MPNSALNEKDVLIVAHMLIAQHGAGAAAFAENRAQEFNLVNKGDGRAIWNRILIAVQEIDSARLQGG